jgi:hypothetical protein
LLNTSLGKWCKISLVTPVTYDGGQQIEVLFPFPGGFDNICKSGKARLSWEGLFLLLILEASDWPWKLRALSPCLSNFDFNLLMQSQ